MSQLLHCPRPCLRLSKLLGLEGLREKLHSFTAPQALHPRKKFKQKYKGNFEVMWSVMMGKLSA